ncbi:MAG: tetratricopeptide repeat protein [Bryobacteraceae bacterium]
MCLALASVFCVSAFAMQVGAPEQAHIRRGIELRDAGDAVGALAQFQRALELNPKHAAIHREVGLLLLERRDFSAAAASFRQAWTLNPADFDSHYNFALALANAGKKQEAVGVLRRLVARKPDFALAYFGLGHVLTELGQLDPAERDFRQSVRLDPSLHRAHFELGRLVERKGDAPAAISSYRAAIARRPDFTAARYRLATLLRQSGDERGARAELDTVRQIMASRSKGERAGSAYVKGLDLVDRGDLEGGIRELERARELRPDFEEIGAALAASYEQWAVAAERNGNVDEAVRRFGEALRFEANPETENHVGVLLAKAGRLDEAMIRFRAALALRPGYSSARRNLDRALALKTQAPAK